MYGLMLLAGIAACIAITGLRWVARGGDWDLIFRVAVWGVGAGIVGARLYHLATSWNEVPEEWWGPFAVWEGGLGIWGGIAGGVLVGGSIAKRSGANVPALARRRGAGPARRAGDRPHRQLVEPGALRQADRRLLGARDRLRAPAGRVHLQRDLPPDIPLRGALEPLRGWRCCSVLDRRFRFRPPALFALYVALYTGFRFYLESLRIDPSKEFLGLRVNAWVSAVLFVGSVLVLRLVAVPAGRPPRRQPHAPKAPRQDDDDPARPRPIPSLVSAA